MLPEVVAAGLERRGCGEVGVGSEPEFTSPAGATGRADCDLRFLICRLSQMVPACKEGCHVFNNGMLIWSCLQKNTGR